MIAARPYEVSNRGANGRASGGNVEMRNDRAGRLVFHIVPGFTMQAFSSAVEVLRVFNKFHRETPLKYKVLSHDMRPVFASNGVAVMPDTVPDEIERGDTIVLVAGAGASSVSDPGTIARLRWWARQGHRIWGVSSGVVRLAQAGLLDGQSVAAHWEDAAYLREVQPAIEITQSIFVVGEKVSTCAGGNACADLMLHEIAARFGRDAADEIAARPVMDVVRDGRIAQSVPANFRFASKNATVFTAIRMMEANLFDPVSIGEIALSQGISQRQLERLFRREFSKSPRHVYSELRLAQARQEVIGGRRRFSEIALDHGFEMAGFAKTYRRVFGALPSEERSRVKGSL